MKLLFGVLVIMIIFTWSLICRAKDEIDFYSRFDPKKINDLLNKKDNEEGKTPTTNTP